VNDRELLDACTSCLMTALSFMGLGIAIGSIFGVAFAHVIGDAIRVRKALAADAPTDDVDPPADAS
jgi:hypothetical protein